MLLGGAVALLPVYAARILKVGAIGLGVLRSAPGVGAVLWPLSSRTGRCVAKPELPCYGACSRSACSPSSSALRAIWWSLLLALILLGASDMVSVIVRHTMVQLATPDEMRGRVSAVNMVFIGASNEVGQFESGFTAQWFGTVPAVILGGIGTIVIVGLWAWLFPPLRQVDELIPVGIPAVASVNATSKPKSKQNRDPALNELYFSERARISSAINQKILSGDISRL